MKKIEVSKDVFALVDDEDYDRINELKWSMTRGYAKAFKGIDGKTIMIRMHRMIMGLDNKDPRVIDHIDFNRLNNQKSNLRICTVADNNRHVKKREGCISKYIGVCRYKKDNTYRWRVQIQCNGVMYRSKRYEYTEKGEIEAAIWYNKKATELFGEFASLNIIPEMSVEKIVNKDVSIG